MPSKSRVRRKVITKIRDHELVPEFKKLSFLEAVEVLKKLGVKPYQLPQISINDPVARIVGAKPGDIIMFRRRSPTAGETVYYRIVTVF